MSKPTELKGLTLEELQGVVEGWGEPSYRASQIAAWIYPRGVTDPAAMTDLSLALRERMAEETTIASADVVHTDRSKVDGTEKLLLKFADGERVEAVILRDDERATGCISTQIGCRYGCTFCATGQMGFHRNLTAAEIVEEIIALRRHLAPERLDNLVFMGMGEPLDNYEATMKAVRIANAKWGLEIGARHMTISTAGHVPGILKLADEGIQVRLAVSLNAPEQRLRAQIMPIIAERYPLDELLKAIRTYRERSGRRVTLEYVLLGDTNDSPQAANELASVARSLLCKINVICYNEISSAGYSPPRDEIVERFVALLRERCPTVVKRVSRGSDIAAGCGQLWVDSREEQASH
jgi:23S rRNA (adenine2503-C2)-methyltransferase